MLSSHTTCRKQLPNRGHGLGWRRQLMDHRDAAFTYSVPTHIAQKPLPPKSFLPELPIWDQGQLGSCTGNGVGAVLLFDAVKQGILGKEAILSRLMIYWMERWMEGTLNEDAGAEIRDGLKVVARYGSCLESGPDSWPYDITKFTQRPPDHCWTAALKFQALNYRPVPQNSVSLRGCLAEGFPVVFGFTCYPELDEDQVANTGLLPMPGSGENPIGGHCVVLWGHDDERRLYTVRNSWGTGWGARPEGAQQRGYFYMPYEYVHRSDLSSDFWTVRVVG